MLIYENIRLALFGLKANKMRALLTMLGIIIGISSVIAIMTLGDSITATVADSMSSMGANNITVSISQKKEESKEENKKNSEEENQLEPLESDYVTKEMIEDLCETYPEEIRAISVQESIGTGELEKEKKRSDVRVHGVSLGYFLANDISIEKGTYFTQNDFEQGSMTALISEDAVEDLFQGDLEKALGEVLTLSVDDKYYEIIVTGVYKESNDNYSAMYHMFGGNASDIYIPLKTAQRISHSTNFQQFTIVTATHVNADDFCLEINRFFENLYRNNRHFVAKGQSLSSIVDMMSSMMDKVTLAIALIGGIALLVGGIGVMNIMLVSVTERTREIGTRKALGAPNSSIRLQFIIESIVICLIGGFIGIVLGCIGGMAAADFIGANVTPSIKSILVSIGFSMAIGVFFGYYPANKAAKLNPIDALRHE